MATAETPLASGTWTFLFTDLEGSTKLWLQFPDAMKTALSRHDELLRTAVEAAHGYVVKTTGDGLFAVFPEAIDGIQASVLAQRSLLDETWAQTGPLRVRMGLHCGEAQVRDGDYFGTAINRTARVMAAANGGQVLLSADLAVLVTGHLTEGASLRDLGEHRLKDLQRPERIYQLVHPALPAEFPAIASLNRLPNNLPLQTTLFVGRHTELSEIKELLAADTVRLLTLTGPGGTGKTRLALQAAAEISDRFVDGTYFVDLAPVREANSVLATIARTLGLSDSMPESKLDDPIAQVRDKSMLLLLDNFEHVTAAAVQVVELLKYCPRLKFLITSREALHVRGERLYPVPSLGLPPTDAKNLGLHELTEYESIQLFVERAQEVKPNFALTTENAADIVELCLRLDGLPLAIELAAARIRLFSPQVLRERLGDRFKLLRGGARDLPERQQTLRDTIAWSYELLTEFEKTLFSVLSVFAGGTLGAVEEVAGDIDRLMEGNTDIVEVLSSLVDKSLVRLRDADEGEPRLRMLETIREYAAEQLAADPELDAAACRAHATYFAGFVARQAPRMTGREREAAMQEMAADADNLRAAWKYWLRKEELSQLQAMVDGLWYLYDRRGWYQAIIELTSDLLNFVSEAPATAEQTRSEPVPGEDSLAEIHRRRGSAYTMLGAFERARTDLEAAHTMAKDSGNRSVEWQTLLDLGLAWASRDYDRTGEYYRVALDLARAIGDQTLLARSLNRIGNWHVNREEIDDSLSAHREAQVLFAQLDDQRGLAQTHDFLGITNLIGADLVQAADHLQSAIALFESLDMRDRLASALSNLALCDSAVYNGLAVPAPVSAAESLAHSERAVAISREIAWPAGEAYALAARSNALANGGQFGYALETAQRALKIAQDVGHRQWTCVVHRDLTGLYMDLRVLPKAQHHAEQAITLALEIKSRIHTSVVSGILGVLLVQQGKIDEADAIVGSYRASELPMRTLGQRWIWLAQAELALAQNNPEAAIQIVDQLIETQINLDGSTAGAIPRVALVRASALAALQRWAEAETLLVSARETAQLRSVPRLLWQVELALSRLYQAQGNTDAAERTWKSASNVIGEIAGSLTESEVRDEFLRSTAA